MSNPKRFTVTSLATLAALSWTTSVVAADEASTSVTPTAVTATPRRAPFASKPVTAAVLATKRGGDGGVFNDAQLKGVVANNSATNVATGSNVISDGAFAGSAGLSTVIQNSGNNVLIQNATIVNVQLK